MPEKRARVLVDMAIADELEVSTFTRNTVDPGRMSLVK